MKKIWGSKEPRAITGSLFEPPNLDNGIKQQIKSIVGGLMRDYTYINGARFSVNNLFRSLRFDIDRLDMSWVDGEKPEFTRGLRIMDNDTGNSATVDGEEADNLIYSLTYIFGKEDGQEAFRNAIDAYLVVALETKQYLVSAQKKDPDGKPEVSESVIH